MNRKSFLTLAAFLCVPLIAAAQGGPAGPWNLTFSDEFNGTALDTTKWATQYTWGCHNNDEQECYQAANVTVSGGSAHLTAQQQTVTSGGTTYNYTSGMIQNTKAFSQTYGYFEMRAKVPKGQGFWPAFWTLPSNGNWPPEIDVIEIGKGGDFTTARMTLHWGSNGSDNYQENDWTSTDFSQAYHVFAVDWEPGVVTWYIDGVQRAQMTTSNVPSIPMYILANLAVGGSWPGNVNSTTPLPSSMDIDYIRAWTKSSSGCYSSIPSPTDAIPSTTCTGSSDTQAPTTPTNLTTSVVSSSQINLTWTASTDNVAVTGYKIYRGGAQVGTATGTTYQDTGLNASTTYSYTVAAYDAAGNNSSQTAAVSATTSSAATTTAPSITSFAASSSSITSGQSVTLSWTVTGNPTPTLTLNGTAVTGTSKSVSPTSTTTYTLAATNSAGSTSAQTTVTVNAASGGSGTNGSGTTTTSSGAPAIFFTDLTSGPNTGGENNNGAYVTLYGNNFGSSPAVTVGGGQALIKVAPTSFRWYQKMTIQLGANARTGNIVVTSSLGSSNAIAFTVRSGNIYFVATSGSDSNNGSFSNPWQTIPKAKNAMIAGDITYVRNGVVANSDDGYGAPLDVSGVNGTATNPIALVTYPGETATIGGSANTRGVTDYPSGSQYLTLAGFTFYSPGSSILQPSYGSTHWNVVGSDISCPTGAGSTGCVTSDNGLPYFRFIGNVLHDTGCPGSMATGPCGDTQKTYHAFYWGDLNGGGNHDVEVGWNDVHNIYGCRAIQFHSKDSSPGYEAYNLQVHDNLIYNVRCDAINLANVNPNKGSIVVYNNSMYHVGTGPDPSGNAANYACINAYDSNGTPTANVEVYNNTCYDPGSRGASEGDAGGYSFFIPTRMRNNLTYVLSGEAYFTNSANSQCPSCTTGTNNLWYGMGAGPSQMTGNVNANPLLVNASSANFRLQQGSPAIGAGVAIPGLTVDMLGTARAQSGSIDIGAFQYAASTTTTSPCDLNGDGQINQTDVDLAMAQALGTSACTNGDLYQSGVCSVIDVQRIINASQGATCRVGI